MSAHPILLPPHERQVLTLVEAAAQLAVSPNRLKLSRCPHAWRTSARGEWRIPWCCILFHGQDHEPRIILPAVSRPDAAA